MILCNGSQEEFSARYEIHGFYRVEGDLDKKIEETRVYEGYGKVKTSTLPNAIASATKNGLDELIDWRRIN